MNRIYRKIFVYSLFIYLGSTMYTRISDCDYSFPGNVLYALPLDAFPLKYIEGTRSVSTQLGVLSSLEVATLLKTNPDTFPNVYEGMTLKQIEMPESDRDYVVLRFKNIDYSRSGNIKCYYSYFPYSIMLFLNLPWEKKNYSNVIFPYSQSLEKDSKNSPEVSIRWRNFL